ncbi:MAG: hypothetical protein HGA77_06730 [Chlorobiaceae bacterium]|nr:hypothetical protein [Chlorobiaceae bacterium]
MEEKNTSDARRVVVTDIRMPFWSMVTFMVKWSFASIPAIILLSIVIGIIMAVVTALFGAMWGVHGLMFRDGSAF